MVLPDPRKYLLFLDFLVDFLIFLVDFLIFLVDFLLFLNAIYIIYNKIIISLYIIICKVNYTALVKENVYGFERNASNISG